MTMKLRPLFLEQIDDVDPWGGDQIDPNVPDDELPNDNDDGMDPNEVPTIQDQPKKKPTKKISAKQQIKQKWEGQNPGITDFEMEDAYAFFMDRRVSLRPYHPYGFIDPETNRHYINVPELTTIVERFPSMAPVLENPATLMDLKNYPWDVIEYYMDIVRANNALVDEENIVPGTKLPLEEQLEIAKERWTHPENQIINEGTFIVYKIESKNESIALGSIQRVLNKMRNQQGNHRGNAYWCTTVPLNDTGRSNLWTTYRPQRAFYYVWDQTKAVDDELYCSSIQTMEPNKGSGPYTFVDLYNSTTTGVSWDEIVQKYPQLQGKQHLLPYFGITPKEREDLTIDSITMTPGDKYYFGTIPKSYQMAYVDSGRHVKKVRAFLTMDPQTRKLYVDKTTKTNNDLTTRFVCDDPNDPFGILEILRLQTKPENLYKYLDGKILKTNLGIPEGILAIKKLIIGNNWRRWLSDDATGDTLVAVLNQPISKNTKFGLMNIEHGEIIKDVQYRVTETKLYMSTRDDDGVIRRNVYLVQKYSYMLGDGGADQDQYFYFITTKEAITDKSSPNYLKGKYFDGPEGDMFLQQQVASGQLKKI